MSQHITEPKINLPDGPFAVLDIGAAKIICLIAEFQSGAQAGRIKVLGASLRAMSGVQDGAVINRDTATAAISAAVDQAEKMAGKTIERAVVAVSGGFPVSHVVELEMELGGHPVGEVDIAALISRAKAQVAQAGREILHGLPVAFGLNGSFGVTPPIGLSGEHLSIAMHIITAQSDPLKNLKSAIGSAHLETQALVLAPYATGLGAITEDEARMGVAVIDFGGGSRDIAIFAQDALLHTEILPTGGEVITENIARALYTPLGEARKLMAHGSAVYDPADERSPIDVVPVGGGAVVQQPRAQVTRVMEAGFRVQLAEIAARLEVAGFTGEAGNLVVLAGGVAQLEGMRELAQDVLHRHVRIASAPPVAGLPESAKNPVFVTALGLLRYLEKFPETMISSKKRMDRAQRGRVAKLLGWMRDNM